MGVTPGGKKNRNVPSRILKDMRRVYERPKESDNNEGLRTLRRFMEDDPRGFVTKLADLEKAHKLKKQAQPGTHGGRAGSGGEQGAHFSDEGQERVEELIGRLVEQAGGAGP